MPLAGGAMIRILFLITVIFIAPSLCMAAPRCVRIQGRLDSTVPQTTFSIVPTSFTELAQNSSFSSTIEIPVTKKQKISVIVIFAKTGTNRWIASLWIDGADVGRTVGMPVQISENLLLRFNKMGRLKGSRSQAILTGSVPLASGAPVVMLEVSFRHFRQATSASIINMISIARGGC
jgi:hypothetical protein